MVAPNPDRSSVSQNSSLSTASNPFWTEFSRDFGSILVVGHGTRNPFGVAQLLALVEHMKVQATGAKISGCFLELAEPSIEQAIEQFSQQGIKKTLVVPVLLFTAGHALQDIPNAVLRAAAQFDIKVIGQTGSLGTHPSVVALSQARYSEVTALSDGLCCPMNACARVQCARVQCSTVSCAGQSIPLGRIGLAMVGRGTSDQQALAQMRQFTELKVAQLTLVGYQTGYFAGGIPNVDELLEQASAWECDTVLVQPHLLFEGELIEQLRDKVLQCQLRFPEKQWLISRTLGADPMLADVLLKIAREQLEL